eukprot:CAMPEP_0114487558 /NCGR_PEP_ID=MMETSP0109-20121206/837_1 /TAXON_ID=29199 /ORGANISM="Chlorarachnion reptans, Strain CCCM449" /LENGTH=756 /DNA_ID=CAMNT_0001663845 /DNA_START=1 /DNA_END=2272 /DNA_ORIENTATION=-
MAAAATSYAVLAASFVAFACVIGCRNQCRNHEARRPRSHLGTPVQAKTTEQKRQSVAGKSKLGALLTSALSSPAPEKRKTMEAAPAAEAKRKTAPPARRSSTNQEAAPGGSHSGADHRPAAAQSKQNGLVHKDHSVRKKSAQKVSNARKHPLDPLSPENYGVDEFANAVVYGFDGEVLQPEGDGLEYHSAPDPSSEGLRKPAKMPYQPGIRAGANLSQLTSPLAYLGKPILNPTTISKIRALTCKLAASGLDIPFPGSQPVSLFKANMHLTRKYAYCLTWKADGTRALCLAMKHGLYLIDRSFRITRIHMRFPRLTRPSPRGISWDKVPVDYDERKHEMAATTDDEASAESWEIFRPGAVVTEVYKDAKGKYGPTIDSEVCSSIESRNAADLPSLSSWTPFPDSSEIEADPYMDHRGIRTLRWPPINGTLPEIADVHHGTLFDAEITNDKLPDGTLQPRILIYDLVALNMRTLTDLPFYARYQAILDHLLWPRKLERQLIASNGTRYTLQHGVQRDVWPKYARKWKPAPRALSEYAEEKLKVQRKKYVELKNMKYVLNEMIPSMPHESDGVVVQPWASQYESGTDGSMLKWKYMHLNSIDFRVRIDLPEELELRRGNSGEGVPANLTFEEVFPYINYEVVDSAAHMPFNGEPGEEQQELEEFRDCEDYPVLFNEGTTVDNALALDGRIVECTWNPQMKCWVFMKERTDKDLPNSSYTYRRVLTSIEDAIDEKVLIQWAENPENKRIPRHTLDILQQ